jgi:hypothetical protein
VDAGLAASWVEWVDAAQRLDMLANGLRQIQRSRSFSQQCALEDIARFEWNGLAFDGRLGSTFADERAGNQACASCRVHVERSGQREDGGFGVFYNRMSHGVVLSDFSIQPPLVDRPSLFFGTMSNLLDSTGVLFPSSVLGLDRNAPTPSVMNFSLTVQRDIGYNTIADIGYVGSLGRHLLWQRNLNAIPFGTNFTAAAKRSDNRPAAAS